MYDAYHDKPFACAMTSLYHDKPPGTWPTDI